MTAIHQFDPRFTLFRRGEAVDLDATGMMVSEVLDEADMAGPAAATEAGLLEGARVDVLFAMPGMSLVHAWFKSGFPLPRHSHDADCLYYIVAGSLRIGTEELAAGDGFFVGADVPYAYTPGPDGVEVLEFRAANAFDFKLLAKNPAFWDKAVETVKSRRKDWSAEAPPSAQAVLQD